MPLNNLITVRKGTEAEWYASAAVLSAGEPGFDTTNGLLKIGDGTSTWENLLNTAIFSDVAIINAASGSTPFSVEGTNGSLFSVVDNLDGTLMSVNNNAGLPVFEVFSDDSIVGGRFGQNDFVISSGGNVGIGTATPGVKLHVVGDARFDSSTAASVINLKPLNRAIEINPSEYNDIILQVNGQNIFRGLDNWTGTWADSVSTTYCQVGRAAGNTIFTSAGGNSFNRLAYSADKYLFTNQTGNISVPANYFNVEYNGTSIISSKTDGKVGIGTTSPSGILHINYSVGSDYSQIALTTPGITTTSHIGVGNSDTRPFLASLNGNLSSSVYGWGFFDRSTDGNFQIRRKGGSTSWSDVLTIQRTNGNIGIGTTTPSVSLEVGGDVNVGYANENINRTITVHSSNPSNKTGRIRHDGGSFIIDYGVGNQGFSLGTSSTRWANGIAYYGGSHLFYGTTGSNTILTINSATSGVSIGSNYNVNTPTNGFIVEGSVGIGTTTPEYKLQVNGSFGATTKSFRIDHPSRPNYTLEYGSLESPYHGVRLTGRGSVIKGIGTISLPTYLKDLIHDDETINIQITNFKHGKTIYVDEINLNSDTFTVKADRAKTLGELQFFWVLTGVRKDVDKLEVEKEKI